MAKGLAAMQSAQQNLLPWQLSECKGLQWTASQNHPDQGLDRKQPFLRQVLRIKAMHIMFVYAQAHF